MHNRLSLLSNVNRVRFAAAVSLVAIAASALTVGGSATAASARQSATKVSTTPPRMAGQWRLAFDDEFIGNRLDLRRWNPNWYGKSKRQPSNAVNVNGRSCDAPSAITQRNGLLSLAITHRLCRTDSGRLYTWTGSLINTWRRFEFTYGYIQARVYLPTYRGQLIDSFSLWADGTGTWPYSGEMDIAEEIPCGPNHRMELAFNFWNADGTHSHCVRGSHPGGWHTFAADWEPGSVTYYYDGRNVGSVTSGITGTPMYLILSEAVNPHSSLIWRNSAALVNYVRVWERR